MGPITVSDDLKSDLARAVDVLAEHHVQNGFEPPKHYTAYLPANHPFWKLSDKEFEDIAGPHVARVVAEPARS
jgi:DNA-binding ferritin-like protein